MALSSVLEALQPARRAGAAYLGNDLRFERAAAMRSLASNNKPEIELSAGSIHALPLSTSSGKALTYAATPAPQAKSRIMSSVLLGAPRASAANHMTLPEVELM